MTNTPDRETMSKREQPQSVSNQARTDYEIFMNESDGPSLEEFNRLVAEAKARKARRGVVKPPRDSK